MKKFLSWMAFAAIVLLSGCDDDEPKSITCSFKGMLNEPKSEYLSSDAENKVDESTEYGKVFSSTFTDATGMFTYTNQCADWTNSGLFTLSGGFTYTNKTDTKIETSIAAICGTGACCDTYLTAFINSMTPVEVTFTNQSAHQVESAYFTNTTYAYLAMENGTAFSKKFEEGDYFTLTITGYNKGIETNKVDVKLAEGTKLVKEWKKTDLRSLGVVDKLKFSLDSSDKGQFSMNTPAYFCMDMLTITE